VNSPSPIRALLFYAVIGTPIAVLVFLAATQFFAAWDGYAVGMLPLRSEDNDAYRVLVVEEDGTEYQFRWPKEIAEGLGIPLTTVLAPPPRIPEDSPHTRKSRFTLHYLVQAPGGGHRIVPTTSPHALALAALVWVIGLFARNMIVAGSPLAWAPQPTTLPAPLPPAGQVAQNRAARSKKGPPPPRMRGKKKRR